MNPSTVAGDASKMLRVNAGGTAYELRTPAQVKSDLSLTTGTDIQAFSARLTEIAALAPTSDKFIAGDGTNFVLKTPAAARTSLGLGGSATLAVGTAAGTVAAGDHVHSAADVTTGTLPVARGGTNATSFTADSLIISNASGTALGSFAPCSSGQVMGSNGTAWGCTTAADSTKVSKSGDTMTGSLKIPTLDVASSNVAHAVVNSNLPTSLAAFPFRTETLAD